MISRWRRHQPRPEPQAAVTPARSAVAGGRAHGLSLAAESASVPLARRTTHRMLTSWGVPPNAAVLDAALLVATELVLNAVRHAAARSPQADLLLSISDHQVEIAVHDDDPHLPVVPAGNAALRHGGLAVVATLAAGFGGQLSLSPDADGPGKTISVLLPLPAP